MKALTTDETHRELALRLDTASTWRAIRYTEAVARLEPQGPAAIRPVGTGYAVFAGHDYPVKFATGVGMGHPVTDGQIEALEHFYRERQLRPPLILCPLADPSLIHHLRKRHYSIDHFFSVMWRSVPTAALPLVPGVEVVEVTSDDESQWLDTVARGFDGEQEPVTETLRILRANFYSEGARRFLAYIDGEAVGGSSLVMHEGVAELCSTSTRVPFRRRGVQSALIHARLCAAREAGCDIAMSQTTPGTASQRNLENHGFQLAYTRPTVVAPQ